MVSAFIPSHCLFKRVAGGPLVVQFVFNIQALQLTLVANGGNTSLRWSPTGLTDTSTEAEVDAYLKNKTCYPVGMFDDTVDGN